MLPTAYKVYHFQPVARFEHGHAPILPGNDFSVVFHGHPVSRELQPLQQAGHRQPLGHFVWLTVQMNGDQNLISTLGAGGGRLGAANFPSPDPHNHLPMLVL